MSEPGDENLLNFLASTVESIRDRMDGIESRMEAGFSGLEARMEAGFERIEVRFTAVQGDIERVHLRLESIERMLSARLDRVEAEVSRLRSVVYLLVKDKPELLRLLGEMPIP